MTTLHKAAQAAIDYLEHACGKRCNAEYNPCEARELANSLRAALAQEPDQNTRIVKVTSQGVSFGDAWFSHERITGKSAACLNEGGSGVAARQYMKWLSTAQEPAPQPKRLTDEQMEALLPVIHMKGEAPKRAVWLTRNDALQFGRQVEAVVLGERP